MDASLSIANIIRAIHHPDERKKWDKDIEVAEVIKVINKNILLWYQKNQSKVKFINQRDFLEKKVWFTHEKKEYVFFTSIPDEVRPVEDKITRAYTVIGYHVFE